MKIRFLYGFRMKVTVELSDEDLREICRVTGLGKKGPAIRQLVGEALRMKRRAEISEKFVTGEWSAELKGYEEAKESDRSQSRAISQLWHD